MCLYARHSVERNLFLSWLVFFLLRSFLHFRGLPAHRWVSRPPRQLPEPPAGRPARQPEPPARPSAQPAQPPLRPGAPHGSQQPGTGRRLLWYIDQMPGEFSHKNASDSESLGIWFCASCYLVLSSQQLNLSCVLTYTLIWQIRKNTENKNNKDFPPLQGCFVFSVGCGFLFFQFLFCCLDLVFSPNDLVSS